MQEYEFGIGSKREKMREKTVVQTFMELSKKVNEMMYLLIGHQLAQGEYEYTKYHINYSAQHRIDIFKTLDSRSIVGLMEQLRMLRYAIDSMESLMSKEMESYLE
jgi:hypothetical protein